MHRAHAHKPSIAPTIRTLRAGPVRDFRARGKLKLVETTTAIEACILCEGTIDRFDREVFLITGRCCACERDLAED